MRITYGVSFGDLDEFCDCKRVIRILIGMLLETQFSVSLLNSGRISTRLQSQDLVGIKRLKRLDVADFHCCHVPEVPEEGDH